MTKRIDINAHALSDFAFQTLNTLQVDAAEVSLRRTQGFSASVRLGDIETLEHHSATNFSVTVFHEHCTGYASTSDLSKPSIEAVIQKALVIAKFSHPDSFSGLADPATLAKSYPDCDLNHPWEMTPSQAIPLAIECEKKALAHDARITNSEGATISSIQSHLLYANTLGFLGEYASTNHSISCSLVASDGNKMQRDGAYTTARNPADLESIDAIAQRAAEKTIAHLGARPIKTQTCPVIFKSSVAKSLLRSFVQAISGGQLYRQSSFLLHALNTPVFPAFISIQQQPHLVSAMGSHPFDAEGVATKDQYYVQDGKLIRYVLGSYSARKLKLETTGNAGGVFNLSMTHNSETLDDLLCEMKTGLLVTELMGQGVNITTGDYSRGASGFWVEHGKIQFPVEEVTIAGNLKDMFAGIVGVANDIDIRSTIRSGSMLIDRMVVAGT